MEPVTMTIPAAKLAEMLGLDGNKIFDIMTSNYSEDIVISYVSSDAPIF